ncbi:hypothetical protein KB236_05600 [Levilactobacillus brevis]|uniref:Surface layer protein A domain-containing protein n=1 Tax=Levilactobacillus hammesii TaxID=267633 RepID=A0A921JW61_9LACO|nr:hypothetical protein KB236_05600 [Levilactobacillus brevis]HJE86845.1 hypothetical protein [Levilactobacillus hammesii]
MTIKKLLVALTAAITLLLVSPGQASAKTWHYAVTPSNSFSTKTFARAFMYGNHEFMELYQAKRNAVHRTPDSGRTISNRQVFYARKTANKHVYEIIYQKKYYYMNTYDTHLYRYNTWRSGHKLISTVKPNQPKKVMLKAKTHVYRNQYWLYNYSGQNSPAYLRYRLADSGKWVIHYEK